MQRQSIDPSAHVHCCRRQPDRIGRQLHHSARINSASQLAGTSLGNVNVQPRSLHRLIGNAAADIGVVTLTGNNAATLCAFAKRRTQ